MRAATLLPLLLVGCAASPTESAPPPSATLVSIATAHGPLRLDSTLDAAKVAAWADAAVECAATRTVSRGAEVRATRFDRPINGQALSVVRSTDGIAFYDPATNTIHVTGEWNVEHECQHFEGNVLGVSDYCRHCQDARHPDCADMRDLDCNVQAAPICSAVGPGSEP